MLLRVRTIDQIRRVAQKYQSEESVKSVARKLRSEAFSKVSLIAQRRRSEVSLLSLRYVCRNVARIVAQAAVLLIVCDSDVSFKGVFRASLRSAVQCCPEVSFRSVAQQRCLRECRSEVLLRSVEQCGPEVLSSCFLGRVPQKCRSEASIRIVAQKCRSEVSMSSVDQKC